MTGGADPVGSTLLDAVEGVVANVVVVVGATVVGVASTSASILVMVAVPDDGASLAGG
ncbi:MAG: hypothetical protein ACO1PW_12325 [Actinomycetota bacterium]